MVEIDPVFKQQLCNAPPDTIFTINKMFVNIDKQYQVTAV